MLAYSSISSRCSVRGGNIPSNSSNGWTRLFSTPLDPECSIVIPVPDHGLEVLIDRVSVSGGHATIQLANSIRSPRIAILGLDTLRVPVGARHHVPLHRVAWKSAHVGCRKLGCKGLHIVGLRRRGADGLTAGEGHGARERTLESGMLAIFLHSTSKSKSKQSAQKSG
jgi:hypothetical protein